MKKVITTLAIIFAVLFTLNAQKGQEKSVTVDTVKGDETVNFNIACMNGGYSELVVQALCTQVGGTSDGTIVLERSVDNSSWETVTALTDIIVGWPNDTLTIVNAAVGLWSIREPLGCYRLSATGTASDTTKITPKYRLR
jgi:hypothetical protein